MIEIDIDASSLVQGLDRFEDALDQQMSTAMSLVVDMVVEDARMRAPQGETGLLRNSIQSGGVGGSFSSGTLEGDVAAAAPYASYVEEGTRPHTIRPRQRKALRWPIEGGYQWAKRVKHPGTRPQPFIGPAIQTIALGDGGQVGKLMDDAVAVAARQSGL